MWDLREKHFDQQRWKNFLDNSRDHLPPFHPMLISFCESLSKGLFAHPQIKHYPDLISLAFWLRPAHLEELYTHFKTRPKASQQLVPRGLAFHIAPSNVETLFVYSWVLSLLVGNANVVRLPSKDAPSLNLLFTQIEELLAQPSYRPIQKSTLLALYAHEEAITNAFSADADLRLIWGGNETIRSIRKIPLKCSAKELVFCDRFSYACIHAQRYRESSEENKRRLAREFYNDVFWYGQMACSSPRLIIWVGSSEMARKASEEFYLDLQKVIEEKHFELTLGDVLQKRVSLYDQVLCYPAKELRTYGKILAVLEIEAFHARTHLPEGAGLLLHLVLNDLREISQIVSPEDQTLVYAGFTQEELIQVVKELNGKGLDRLVPIGQALQFDYLWDGYDLLMELSRMVCIT